MSAPAQLRTGIVLRTDEDACSVLSRDRVVQVPYALPFPRPRVERVLPGHLVAVADSVERVLWRWYDAVVLGDHDGQVRLWEPAHGEVLATPRDVGRVPRPGSRAYLSAGLPGADWWVAGPAVERAEDAEVELDEVARLYTRHGMWDQLG